MGIDDTTQSLTAIRLLEHARRSVPELTAQEAKARLDRGEFDLILDVRESEEWQKGRLPGAVHAPRGMLEFHADPSTKYARSEITSRREANVLIACASGCRSLLAAETLQRMGYRRVASLAGGLAEWVRLGLPVEGGSHPASGSSRSLT
jgi:rhodanese-related sulfurtransferase